MNNHDCTNTTKFRHRKRSHKKIDDRINNAKIAAKRRHNQNPTLIRQIELPSFNPLQTQTPNTTNCRPLQHLKTRNPQLQWKMAKTPNEPKIKVPSVSTLSTCQQSLITSTNHQKLQINARNEVGKVRRKMEGPDAAHNEWGREAIAPIARRTC